MSSSWWKWTPPPPRIEVQNDGDAGRVVMQYFGDRVLREAVTNDLYVEEQGCVWVAVTQQNAVNFLAGLMLRERVPLRFVNMDAKTRDNYHENRGGGRNVAGQAIGLARSVPNLRERMRLSVVGRLCYRNGHYDFEKRAFVDLEGPDVMTAVRVPFDFPERPSDDEIAELYDRVLIPTFPDEEQRAAWVLYAARSLSGDVTDKKWALFIGPRNCGKGVLTRLLEAAFPGYVDTFNANSLVRKRGQASDADRELAFANPFVDARIMIANEVKAGPDSVVDGTLLKSLASGGDRLRTRRLYKEAGVVKTQAHMIINVNDMPTVEPVDAMNNVVRFRSIVEFVDDPSTPARVKKAESGRAIYRVADESVYAYVETERAIRAITHVLLDAYRARPVYPDSVKVDVDNEEDDVDDVVAEIVEYTGDQNDFVTTAQIERELKKREYYVGPERLKSIMTVRLGAVNKRRSVDGRTQRGYAKVKMVEVGMGE